MNNNQESYDPNSIIQAAEEKRKHNDIQGAQMMYQSALLNWVDAAREGGVSDPDQVREAIATLWLAYAHFNQSANMFKSAQEAYEQAVVCPVAGSVGRVWLDYARFAQDRNKLRTAQKIYLRALVGVDGAPAAVTDEQDRTLLWNEFLEMMKQEKPELKMAELKKAVQDEHLNSASQSGLVDRKSPVPPSLGVHGRTSPMPTGEPPEKRPRLGESPVPPPTLSKTHVVTAEEVSTEAAGLLDLIQAGLPPEISAAWFVRDGDSPPTPPTPLFTPSPPKLSDPTGKEILGAKLALAVITRLLKKDDDDNSGTILLEVCRGLWTLSALTEKRATSKIESLDKSMNSQMEKLDATLDTRLSVAGAASSAVQQMNDNERNAFQQSCCQKRQEALNSIAWDFRNLLCTQQLVLTKLKVPGFDGPTVDANALELQSRLCSYLYSAFFLRSRIGDAPHQAMLKSQVGRLKSDLESQPTPQLPTDSSSVPPPPPFPVPVQQQQILPQQQMPPMYSPAFPQYSPQMYAQQQFVGQPMQVIPQGGVQQTLPNMQYGQQLPPQYYQQQQQ